MAKPEAAVKSVKNLLKRTSHDKSGQCLALLEMRNTPRQDVNRSPAHILFGRFTRSVLPVFLKPCTALDVLSVSLAGAKPSSVMTVAPDPSVHCMLTNLFIFNTPRGRGGLEATLCAALARVRTL